MDAQRTEARVAAVIAAHGDVLRRVARRYSATPDDAEDAVQRGLEIYVRRLARVDPATEAAWLKVVVKHEALALRRARRDGQAGAELDLDAHPAPDQRPLEDVLAGRERAGRVAEALRRLKPDEARALLLQADGLSYGEIGERMGWSYTKVNRALTEGRKHFFERYEEIEGGAACEQAAPALAALARGRAGARTMVELRPHLRHCAACRATVRRLHARGRARLGGLVPLPWLHGILHRLAGADVVTGVQHVAAAGGGRMATVSALAALCLGGPDPGSTACGQKDPGRARAPQARQAGEAPLTPAVRAAAPRAAAAATTTTARADPAPPGASPRPVAGRESAPRPAATPAASEFTFEPVGTATSASRRGTARRLAAHRSASAVEARPPAQRPATESPATGEFTLEAPRPALADARTDSAAPLARSGGDQRTVRAVPSPTPASSRSAAATAASAARTVEARHAPSRAAASRASFGFEQP
jgi:RNA polymerase sigma factor (sigma-70 family)